MGRHYRSKKGSFGILIFVAVIYLLTHVEYLIAGAVLVGFTIAGYVWFRAYEQKRIRQSGIETIDNMDGFEFEQYLGHLFRGLGYKSTVTQASGDFGADVVLQKGTRKIVVQAKRYGQGKKVGLKAVQEIHTALSFYGATEGWVVTNRTYSDAAQRLAVANGVRLIDRNGLVNLILRWQSRQASEQPDPQDDLLPT